MSRIAVFGGSFDPVHKSHIQIAQEALQAFDLRKVFFTVSHVSPHKTRFYASIKDRIFMLKLAIKSMQQTESDLYEIKEQKTGYSYQILDHFHSLYPTDELYMIIGSDSLLDLPTWKNIDYLAKRYRFIVAKRSTSKINKDVEYLDRCVFVNKKIKNISSTQIRTLIKKNCKQMTSFLNKEVYTYILQNGLYK